MKKSLWAAVAAATIVGSGLAVPAVAYAAPARSCAQLGHRVVKGDPDYVPALDGDKDGVACEAYPDRPRTSNVADIPSRDLWCSQITRRNIPAGDPEYTTARDRDLDGVACEANDLTDNPRPTRSATPTRSAAPTKASKQNSGGLAKTGA